MIGPAMEHTTTAAEPVAASPTEVPPELRGAPPPRHGGLITLLRFMRSRRMLTPKYLRLIVRLARKKLRFRGKLRLDGLAFIGPGVTLEMARGAHIELGRWSWVGHRCKLRCHE